MYPMVKVKTDTNGQPAPEPETAATCITLIAFEDEGEVGEDEEPGQG